MTDRTSIATQFHSAPAVIDRIVLWTGILLMTISVALTLTPQPETALNTAPPGQDAAQPSRPV